MSFTLDFTAWIIAYAVVIGLTVIALAVAAGSVVAENRPVRLARHESIPRYYGRLLHGH